METVISIEKLKNLNIRLHRRCQELESMLAKNKTYLRGVSDGRMAESEAAAKGCELQLAAYKFRVRKTIKSQIQRHNQKLGTIKGILEDIARGPLQEPSFDDYAVAKAKYALEIINIDTD